MCERGEKKTADPRGEGEVDVRSDQLKYREDAGGERLAGGGGGVPGAVVGDGAVSSGIGIIRITPGSGMTKYFGKRSCGIRIRLGLGHQSLCQQ